MTTEEKEIETLLLNAGLKRNSGDYSDYGRATRIIFKGKIVEHEDYERAIKIITAYLNV